VGGGCGDPGGRKIFQLELFRKGGRAGWGGKGTGDFAGGLEVRCETKKTTTFFLGGQQKAMNYLGINNNRG